MLTSSVGFAIPGLWISANCDILLLIADLFLDYDSLQFAWPHFWLHPLSWSTDLGPYHSGFLGGYTPIIFDINLSSFGQFCGL